MDQNSINFVSNLYAVGVYKKLAACAEGLSQGTAFPKYATKFSNLTLKANWSEILHDVLRRPDWTKILPVMVTDALCGNTKRTVEEYGYRTDNSGKLIRTKFNTNVEFGNAFQIEYVLNRDLSEFENEFTLSRVLNNHELNLSINLFTVALDEELRSVADNLKVACEISQDSATSELASKHLTALFKFVRRLTILADECALSGEIPNVNAVHAMCRLRGVALPPILDSYISLACKKGFSEIGETLLEPLGYLLPDTPSDDLDDEMDPEELVNLIEQMATRNRDSGFGMSGFKPSSSSSVMGSDDIDDLVVGMAPDRASQLKRLHQYDKKRQQEMEEHLESHLFG